MKNILLIFFLVTFGREGYSSDVHNLETEVVCRKIGSSYVVKCCDASGDCWID